MNCSNFNKLLDNYENLSKAQSEELNNHAAVCENCRGELEFFRSIRQSVSSLPYPAPPADLLDRINAKIDAEAVESDNNRKFSFVDSFRKNVRYYATCAACLAVGIVVALNGNMITKRMSDNDDGVIESTVTTESKENTGTPSHEDKHVVSEQPVVKQPTATAVPPAQKNESVTSQDPVKPNNTVTAQPAVVASAPAVTAKPHNTASAVTVKPNTASEPVVTASPATPQATQKSNYTIDKNQYSLPSVTEAHTEKETMDPEAAYAGYTLRSQDDNIALGNEGEEEIIGSLLISVKDYGAVVSILSEYGITYNSEYYEGAAAAMYAATQSMDAAGIQYSFNCSGSTVKFKISTY